MESWLLVSREFIDEKKWIAIFGNLESWSWRKKWDWSKDSFNGFNRGKLVEFGGENKKLKFEETIIIWIENWQSLFNFWSFTNSFYLHELSSFILNLKSIPTPTFLSKQQLSLSRFESAVYLQIACLNISSQLVDT